MTKAKAKELVITALKTAIGRDTATGNGIDGIIFSTKEEVAEEFHIDL
jgi:20S proteasome alpha/beta subunit